MTKEIRYKWTGAAYVPDPPITTEEAVAYLRSIGITVEYAVHNSPEFLLFHRLWSKAVGTADYVKSEWQKLEHALFYAGRTEFPAKPISVEAPTGVE